MTRLFETPLLVVFSLAACASGRVNSHRDALPEASIIDSGSTNRPGMRITLDGTGSRVTLEPRAGAKQQIKLPRKMCEQFLRDVAAAGPINRLPATHCLKSASFGSRLFIEFSGLRSPDLDCPAQADERTANLKKEATEILKVARKR
jgi:hypothetical protein